MNREWADKWMAMYNDGDIADFTAMYAEIVDHEDVIFGEKRKNKKELTEFFHAYSDAGEHRFDVTNWVGDETGGAIEFTWVAKHAFDLCGQPAAGKNTETQGVAVFTFDKDGKITSEHDYWNAVAMYRQLGVID